MKHRRAAGTERREGEKVKVNKKPVHIRGVKRSVITESRTLSANTTTNTTSLSATLLRREIAIKFTRNCSVCDGGMVAKGDGGAFAHCIWHIIRWRDGANAKG